MRNCYINISTRMLCTRSSVTLEKTNCPPKNPMALITTMQWFFKILCITQMQDLVRLNYVCVTISMDCTYICMYVVKPQTSVVSILPEDNYVGIEGKPFTFPSYWTNSHRQTSDTNICWFLNGKCVRNINSLLELRHTYKINY